MRLTALLVCSALLASNPPNLSAQQWDNVAALGGSLPSKPDHPAGQDCRRLQ